MNRNFVLSDMINESSIKEVLTMILEINESDQEEENKLKDFKREPIHLFLNTSGGNIYDGLALVDIIIASKTTVYTYCIGKCLSMGLIIFMAGHKRFIGHNATIMFHGASFGIDSTIPNIEETLEEVKRLQTLLTDFILQKSKLKRQELDIILESRADWYLAAKDAIKKGIADSYL